MGSAFSINLDGAQVVGGVTTTAFGTGFAVYDETAVTLTYEIRIFGLDFGDLFDGGVEETADAGDDVTTAHIHIGNIGSSGGVAFAFLNDNDLTQVENADGSRTIRGVWDESDGQPITPYSTTFANAGPGDDMGLYFNIHTASFGGGEIRGQIIGNADELGNTVTGTSARIRWLASEETICCWAAAEMTACWVATEAIFLMVAVATTLRMAATAMTRTAWTMQPMS